MNPDRPLYLSSMESTRLAVVRRCRLLRRMSFETGKDCALVEVSPPILGQDFDQGADITRLLLSCRHEGATLFPPSEFPLFVHVALAREDAIQTAQPVRQAAVTVIGWAELYATEAAARGGALRGRTT